LRLAFWKARDGHGGQQNGFIGRNTVEMFKIYRRAKDEVLYDGKYFLRMLVENSGARSKARSGKLEPVLHQ
jgi:hypothetical protein